MIYIFDRFHPRCSEHQSCLAQMGLHLWLWLTSYSQPTTTLVMKMRKPESQREFSNSHYYCKKNYLPHKRIVGGTLSASHHPSVPHRGVFPSENGEREGEECPRAVARTRPPPRSTGRLALGTFRRMGWGKLLPWNADNSYSHPPPLLESRSWDWRRWRLQLWELACSIPMVLSTHHVALEPRVWFSSLAEKWMCAQNWSSGTSVCPSDLFILQMLY